MLFMLGLRFRRATSSSVWAASFNQLWNKVYASVNQAVFFAPSRKPRNRTILEVTSHVWIVAEKIRTTRQLLQCSLVRDEQNKTVCLQVDRPFLVLSSVNFFMEQWDKVRSGGGLAAYSVQFSNLKVVTRQGSGHIVADVDVKSCSKMFELRAQTPPEQAKAAKAKASPRPGGRNFEQDGGGDDDDDDKEDEGDCGGEDEDYGLDLLRQDVASCTGMNLREVPPETAASASFAEASGASDGALEKSAVHDMIGQVAEHVDTELDIMCRVENDLLEKAFVEKKICLQELQPHIDRLLREGVPEDEAVFEAALNSSKLLGNVSTSDPSEVSGTTSGPATTSASSTSSPAAAASDSASASANAGDAGADMVNNVVFPMSAQQKSELCLRTHTAAFSASIRALLQCLYDCANSKPQTSSLALGYCPVDVEGVSSYPSSRRLVLIHWEVAGKTGRVARVDDQGRVISMVCVGANRMARDLSTCAMINPNIGIGMERVKRKERAQIPDHVLRVSQMFLQAESLMLLEAEEEVRQLDLAAGNGDNNWADVAQAGDECSFCGAIQVPSGPVQERGSESEQRPRSCDSCARQCPLCLLSWHAPCGGVFVQQHKSALEQLLIHPEQETAAASWLQLDAFLQRDRINNEAKMRDSPRLLDRRESCYCYLSSFLT